MKIFSSDAAGIQEEVGTEFLKECDLLESCLQSVGVV